MLPKLHKTVIPVSRAMPLPYNRPFQASACTGDVVEAHIITAQPLLGEPNKPHSATRAAQLAAEGRHRATRIDCLLAQNPKSSIGSMAACTEVKIIRREPVSAGASFTVFPVRKQCPWVVAALLRW